MLTDVQWATLERLIAVVRPPAKVPLRHLRRTISAILWRHDNGAKWRAVPDELGPWWMAAQTFIRCSRLNVWERLLTLVQEQGVQLGMTFLDGTNIRAHQKAAGAAKKPTLQYNETIVKHLAALVVAMEPRLAWSPTQSAGPWRSSWPQGRRTSCRMLWRCSTNCQTYPAGSSPTVATVATLSASTSGAWAELAKVPAAKPVEYQRRYRVAGQAGKRASGEDSNAF